MFQVEPDVECCETIGYNLLRLEDGPLGDDVVFGAGAARDVEGHSENQVLFQAFDSNIFKSLQFCLVLSLAVIGSFVRLRRYG